MYYDIMVGGQSSTVPIVLDGERGWVCLWGSNADGVVMQSTGLTDRKGREIYEGDIVSGYMEYNTSGERFTGVVTWEDASFRISMKPKPYSPPVAYEGIKRIEVIGNIYQNPELLP